jgi:hypothetical protein
MPQLMFQVQKVIVFGIGLWPQTSDSYAERPVCAVQDLGPVWLQAQMAIKCI